MPEADENTVSEVSTDAPQETRSRRDRGVDSRPAPPNPLEPGSGGVPKRLLLGVGAILLVGLAITVVMIRTSTPGWKGVPPTGLLSGESETVEPVMDRLRINPPTIAVNSNPTPQTTREAQGPTGTITVPSAGLRARPSISAKELITVVKKNERVTILKRVSSDSGPDWIQIATPSGKVGWVWASVVREGKAKKRS